MTVDNLKTRKSVPPHESGQGQMGSVDLLVGNSTSLPDEIPGVAMRGDPLSEAPCSYPSSSSGKVELQSKLVPPAPPTIVWRKLMLEQ
ncbi:hypothetical protein D9M71_783670 [compost metagenome]